MKKATFKGKTYDRYNQKWILTYEYKGHEYDVIDGGWKGGEQPLYIQHRDEQQRIDREIEERNNQKPEKPYRYEDTAEYGFKLFWDYVEGDRELPSRYWEPGCEEPAAPLPQGEENYAGEELPF